MSAAQEHFKIHMIKFIASDLDGTLLDPNGDLPQETFRTIEQLHRKGILFCAASGRQLAALQQMFAPVADKIMLMAENGAIVSYKGDMLCCSTIAAEDVRRAIDAVGALRGAHALLCTPACAYYQDEAQPFLDLVRASYISNARAALADIAREKKVCKVAVYDDLGPEYNAMQYLPKALPQLRVIQSGGNWLDISEKHANKGSAMRFIRRTLGLKQEECAAFGDHMNDYEMLQECGFPYVTENAYPPLKRLIGKSVGTNSENGVIFAMQAIAEGAMP